MKIRFNMDTLKPMIDWLLNYKKNGVRDEDALKSILAMPDYAIEFERYSMEGLPVCGISLEESVDFFMNFDRKDFENPRLAYKKKSFLKFFNELEDRVKKIEMFTSVSESDYALMESLLENGLPADSLKDIDELTVILIVSIGNSMGWPYENYVDYDVANLNLFETKEDFLHVTAHEINHIFVGGLLAPEGITGQQFFLQNFAYEGLAVHYNNNLATLMKPAKYPYRTYMMEESDMRFYEEHFDEIFDMIRTDYKASEKLSVQEAAQLVSDHYEKFEFMGKKVMQYPTYYFGCYMWGLVDLAYGKERLYESIADPALFVQLYNKVAKEEYRF